MITVKTLITSKIDAGQKEQILRVAEDALRKGMGMGVDKLSESGALNTSNFQRVLAQGNALATCIIEHAIAKLVELAEQVVGFLKLISGIETITIRAVDGQATIAKAGDLFTGWLDNDFVNYGTDVPGQATKEMPVQVFEMIKDGTFAQIFGGFGENLDRLCLTQAQIIQFVKDHSRWLHPEGWATFFLFKVNGEYFVAFVYRGVGRLGVFACRLSYDHVWRAECRHRVVVPQL